MVSADGVTWLEVRRTLEPDFRIVRREIGAALAMLLGGHVLYTTISVARGGLAPVVAAPLLALWVGFWLLSILSFGHEATHFNIAANRRTNERLARWFLFPFLGMSVEGFRSTHWQHHMHLGDHHDTEVSYRECFDPAFLLKSAFGLQALQVRARYSGSRGAGRPNAPVPTSQFRALAVSMTVHGLLVLVPLAVGAYGAALGWAVGAIVVFPALLAIRNVLEHRGWDADCNLDYREHEHGPVNRLFGTGIVARHFGAAGFNRHLLHHWDPGVSYTRFDDMQAFLMSTPFAEELERVRAGYIATARHMLRQRRHA
ncbi:MAG: fatty acid desaturase [Planctomycetes bacterium]|nr:fatty acid desaturase [Planctomycetota bacterium]